MAVPILAEADRLLSIGQVRAAASLVQSAVEAGDVDAAFQLAIWRLVGQPVQRDLPDARRLLLRATQAGHADAPMILAALVANGSGAAPDWPQALGFISAAAATGNTTARQHLDLIARMNLYTDGAPRDRPTPQILGSVPKVRRWHALLSEAECAHIATSVLDILEPSMVVDPRTGRQIAHPVRKSSAAVIDPTRETLPIQAINRRIAAVTGTTVRQGEPLAVLHYAPGQQYLPHVDTLPNEPNQRIMTVLIYLNAGYLGGGTQFPASDLTVVGGLGDVIAFDNVRTDGSPDPASRHAGLPVQRGTKWLATRWIRQEPLDVWAPRG